MVLWLKAWEVEEAPLIGPDGRFSQRFGRHAVNSRRELLRLDLPQTPAVSRGLRSSAQETMLLGDGMRRSRAQAAFDGWLQT